MKPILAPSMLAADFSKLGEELKMLENAGVTHVHIDVMDGHFVPNITIGPAVVRALRPVSGLVFDVHLMLKQPLRYISPFAQAGADVISFHIEADDDAADVIEEIKSFGKRPAITINPDTDAERILPYIKRCGLDMVLVMSVYPGFGGQRFMENALPKVQMLRRFAEDNDINLNIEVDGGVNISNVTQILGAGADMIVAGTDIFNHLNPVERIREYQSAFRSL